MSTLANGSAIGGGDKGCEVQNRRVVTAVPGGARDEQPPRPQVNSVSLAWPHLARGGGRCTDIAADIGISSYSKRDDVASIICQSFALNVDFKGNSEDG
jgi:hypothetical protein